jgi:hypothetical protein
MFPILQVISVLLVAVAMAFALAHAAELPGKMRLSKETYLAVQPIYYPGFTLGGLIGDFGGTVALIVLLVLTPSQSAAFWWTAAALACLVTMNLIYWLWTHPVNNFWVKDAKLTGIGAAFFSVGASQSGTPPDWTQLRNVWEYSHVARAIVAVLGLVLLSIGMTR